MQPESPQFLRIDLNISAVPYTIILRGLEAWLEWDLISDFDFRWRSDRHASNRLMVVARQNEAILQGLNFWLDLGLIDQSQVRLICKTSFTCEIKSVVIEPIPNRANLAIANSQTDLVSSNAAVRSRLARSPVAQLQKQPKIAAPSKIEQTVGALFSEFSTIWLLFLGVFMVVVSSGLLAASQWDNFSPEIQYLLLLAYTVGFFGVSFWTSSNQRLRMTTRALQLATLLLVPANFWAMDGLNLIKNPIGIAICAIAGFGLSAIAIFLLQTSFTVPESQKIVKSQLSHISILAILLLNWLHLGWFISPYYPLIAVYLGLIAIVISTFINRYQNSNTADSSTFPLALITGGYSTLLLISRALLFGNVAIFKLGLAFGLGGWILLEIKAKAKNLRSPSALQLPTDRLFLPSLQSNLGQILLALGWFVSVWDQYPWQAFGVSLLVLLILGDRLIKYEDTNDFTYLFAWVLQTFWLGQRLIPEAWKNQSTQNLLTLFQTQSETSLFGVILFPYLIITLVIAAIYRRRHKLNLAIRGESLGLGFGGLLTSVSSLNITTLAVNLTLSAITLFVFQSRRSATSKNLQSLIYFTHIISLSAISLGLYLFTRSNSTSTSIFAWVGFLLITMVIEWIGVLVIGKIISQANLQNLALQNLALQRDEQTIHLRAWRDSAWHIGATLAALSYILLWNSAIAGQSIASGSEILISTSYWSVIWLLVPISLTFLGTWREFVDRNLAINLSISGLAIAQFLTSIHEGSRLIGFGVAFALMLINTRRNKSLLTAFNTVGYGLLFIAVLLGQFQSNRGVVAQFTLWANGMVCSAILLYILNHWLKYRRENAVPNLNLSLNQSYALAFDIWAAMLSAGLLILESIQASLVFGFDQNSQLFINLLPSTILVTLGLVYRIWQSANKPPFWAEWGIAWSIELLASGAIAVSNGSAIELAIANIGLGFLTQLLGDWWMQRQGTNQYPRSWDIIPLIYGVMGSLLRVGNFSGLTGLFSLSTSLIGISIGRRSSASNPIFKTLTYLSMAVATFSVYELLFYQMVSRSAGGSLGDGLVVLAALGGAIAYAYQLFSHWISPYLKLSIQEITISAHLHWFASAVLILFASFANPSVTGGRIGSAIMIALAAYAIVIARTSLTSASIWTYTGITTAIGAIAYLIFFAFPNALLLNNLFIPYAAAIACFVSTIIYLPDWQEWGWEEEPWHNSAFLLPLIFTFVTQGAIALPCIIIVGIFYIVYAKLKDQIRATYITMFIWDWTIFNNVVLSEFPSLRLLLNVGIIGFSGLYFAQVEPNLRSPNRKEARHSLRTFAVGGMGVIGFIYSLNSPSLALIVWSASFAAIIAGLALQVRAYLFMGTLTFMLLVLTQAITLVTQYAFLMWSLGIIAGIGFILVAANFEVRRDRILMLFKNVAIGLEAWQ